MVSRNPSLRRDPLYTAGITRGDVFMDDKTRGHLEIGIDGMTCASCSARVERALGALYELS